MSSNKECLIGEYSNFKWRAIVQSFAVADPVFLEGFAWKQAKTAWPFCGFRGLTDIFLVEKEIISFWLLLQMPIVVV